MFRPLSVTIEYDTQRGRELGSIMIDSGTEKERGHGRYYAEHARITSGDRQERLQALLDEKEAKRWHLVGVSGGQPEDGIILFWDVERPSFGRHTASPNTGD